jgi:hypothetical protein
MDLRSRSPSRWAAAAAAACALVLLTVWLLAPLSTSPGHDLYDASSFHGVFLNQPDIELNGWILAWGAHALSSGNFSGFFDTNIFHPVRQTLVLSEHMLGVQPMFAPLYLSTLDLTLALNLWALSTFVLCGIAMYWVALRWFGSHAAAAVAAVAYAFAPWRFSELSHVQMLSVQYLPLLAYAVWRSADRRDARLWLAICGLTLMQALSCYYLAYMAFLLAGIVATASLVLFRPARSARVVYVGSALLVAALVMIPVTLPYIGLRDVRWYGVKFEQPLYWPLIRVYLFPPLPTGVDGPWGAWWGVPWVALLGLVLAMRASAYRSLAIALAAVGLLGAVFAVGGKVWVGDVRIFDLDRLLSAFVPGWSAVRVYNRFAVLTWLAMSLLAALPFARHACGDSRLTRLVGAATGTAVVTALLYSAAAVDLRTRPSPEVTTDTEPHRWLATHGEGDPVLDWPPGFSWDESRYMFLSTLHWLPLVNGYSGYRPAPSRLILELARSLPEREATRTLVGLNVVRWLLVHRRNGRYGERDWSALEQMGAELRLRGDYFALYELPYQHDRAPAASLLDADPRTSVFDTPKTTLRPTDLAASVRPLQRHAANRILVGASFPVWVRNQSSVKWPSVGTDEEGLVGLTFRAGHPGENGTPTECGGFSRLPADLAPGQEAVVWALCQGPAEAGTYELVPCLTQRGRDVTHCFDRPESLLELTVMRGKRK